MNSLLSNYNDNNVKRINPLAILLTALTVVLLVFACRTLPKVPVEVPVFAPEGIVPPEAIALPEISVLNLTFAGDIMAHTVNYAMPDYNRIYEALRPILLSDDLSFANLEAPVAANLPLSTYPRFNVHLSYVLSAIQGGFDVFSLANNHANDQGSAGIAGTLASLETIVPSVYYSGLRKKSASPMEPVVIKKNGWTVLFLSVTEILNSYDASGKLVYYVPPTEKGRSVFLSELTALKKANPNDVFILSIHLNEPEYVRSVNSSKRKWFSQLSSAGVDIIWGHHPHVMQEWGLQMVSDEFINRPVLNMFSMGNFISGQRYSPEKENPAGLREYTGDAVLLQVQLSRSGKTGYDKMSVSPVLVTNYAEPGQGVVVRLFDDAFASSIPPRWRDYYQKRSDYMHAYLPLLPSSAIASILEE